MNYGYQDIYAEFIDETIDATIVEETIDAAIVEETIETTFIEETLMLEITDTEEIQADLAAEEITIDVESWSCPQIPTTGGSGGYIFITDVTTSGIAANYEYEPDTVPANSVLTSVTVDSDSCEVHFLAEGGSGYSPTVEIDGIKCSNLAEVSQDKRLFTGSIPVTITETTKVTVKSSTDQEDSVMIVRAAAAPEILSCTIGNYPGSQTAAKQGDSIHVTGTVEGSAAYVRLIGYGAFQNSGWVSCSGGTFNITGTIGGASGTYGARVYAKNLMGSEGSTFDSSNEILLDQNAPSFLDLGTTFPVNQSALKGTETAIQGTRVQDFSSVTYSSPHGDISVANPTTYEENKTVQCTAPGDYNDSIDNFKIEAYKASNDTSNMFQKNIEVADTAPTISVSQSSARLRSSPSGQTHTITASGDQNLASAPGIGIPVSGTWQGSGFTGGPKNWTRTISITDNDLPGQGDWILNTIPTNRAGIAATSISGTQNVGGFVSRSFTLPAFGTSVTLGAYVTDTNKLQFSWSFKSPMYFQVIGSSPPVVSGWTIDAVNSNPTEVIILDTQTASASSQDSTITIEENI